MIRRLRPKRRPVWTMMRMVRGLSHPRDFDLEFWRRCGIAALMDAACRMAEDARGFAQKWKRRKTPVDVDFRGLLSALNRHHARYLVVGAYAVMSYTEPRHTKGLDVWVDSAAENTERVLRRWPISVRRSRN
jgi:hypothetical protein